VADTSRSPLRLGVLLALTVVALFQFVTILQGVGSTRRLQARVTHDVEQAVAAARPQLLARLSQGDLAAPEDVAALAVDRGLATEAEVIGPRGESLVALPAPSPVSRRLRPDERQRVAAGQGLTLIAGDGSSLRVLSYLGFAHQGRPLMLRLATAAPDLEAELRERRQILLGHGVALAGLLVAAALVLLPRRVAPPAPPQGALHAYEEAMELLRDRGEEMTARHEQERERLQAAMREKDALARAGELTAGIVHEVRNGLGTIVGYARLAERGESAPDARDAARAILEECQTLETVVRRFNEFIRQERLNLADLDLSTLLRRVTARELRGRDEVALSLVGLDEPLTLRGDEELLERALENLVRNAAEAAQDGGRQVEIEAIDDGRGHIELVIADDGPGFTPDHPGDARPFFTTKPGGLGLGLPLARKILLLHGGHMELEDGPEGGALVRVVLPAAGPRL
jgi:signal transduction histidine kinase